MPDYVETVDAKGYVNTGHYSYDDGWHSDAAAKYKISEKTLYTMRYELLHAEDWHLSIYDTLSFYLNFKYPDSSFYVFIDSEYNAKIKKREVTVTHIPLSYKAKLVNIKDCEGCNIYKFESEYHDECYTWFMNDSIGFVKTYGPYHYNVPNYEIRFLLGTPKYYYALKLVNAIKVDKQFHTRCSPGALW